MQHDKSMLDGTFCWATGSYTLPQWMQIDLGSSFRVHGVVTQCRFDADQCVLEMEVQYSLTTSNFVSATAVDGTTRFFLPTSYSSTAKTMSNFSQPVTARYIRILPVHARGRADLAARRRVERLRRLRRRQVLDGHGRDRVCHVCRLRRRQVFRDRGQFLRRLCGG
ncbi:MAG: discoidin domain-containing protein [Proteobacteria bacterium]|nr:discoidin domain-containing protein [Pseudomonadota bacterium]